MDKAVPTILYAVWAGVIVAVPVMLVWGWIRWTKRKPPLTLFAGLSFTGFALATASALLAIAEVVYAQAIGGFPFYDPRLLRIYRWGALLSLSGTLLALAGVWRPSPLRWHALTSAFGALVFWVLAASGE